VKLEIEFEMETETETDIEKFYKNKSIFLTGGTGFLGKVYIEKVLRVTEVKRIYILVRPKRGMDIESRVAEILKDPLFEKLYLLKKSPEKYLHPIAGDCSLPGLGLSNDDNKELIENVNIIVHSAATVRFNEPLSYALSVNVNATLDLIKLAKKMHQLCAFVHVSSAFANCFETHIEERFYSKQIGISSEKACLVANILGAEQTDQITPEFIKNFPNTYCFTKALAEEAILTNANDLPVCIFRPAIVIPTCKEPVAGWIDNLYGPTSILYGVAYGVLRVMYVRIHSNANIVPVDFCANLMLTCGWKTAITMDKTKIQSPTIYNLVPTETNSLKWSEYRSCIENYGLNMPVSNMIWYPTLTCTDSKIFYSFLCFFCHIIPGYIFDFILVILGKKPRLVKTYKKIHNTTSLLNYFTENDWTFSNANTNGLWNSLTPREKELFNFDMTTIDWKQYFYNSLQGMRLYLAKESPATIPKAKKMYKKLEMLHRLLQILLYGSLVFVLCWLIVNIFFK